MKMIIAIVRPEKLIPVEDALKEKDFFGLTEISVRGRGKQKGITIGEMKYEKLPKEMVMMVCADEDAEQIKDIIVKTAYTGSVGDGKIFTLNVEDEITVRASGEGK
ncbi:P-II family nitrogen regulator [Candidatus Haliotispira prima]|uniref:P-II family nitrogen regulator n=1 Tax=Candidatus Haliotispira prima TaxID=3034016 RepID=A0ABY8MJG3_9SPIO|nr:P-II family nitrogen regulator [Candidatus Haliotispira prima]